MSMAYFSQQEDGDDECGLGIMSRAKQGNSVILPVSTRCGSLTT